MNASGSVQATRRQVWVGMLLYPAHTLPTAAAPVAVACGLALRDHVFAPVPALLAFLSGWLVQLGGVITDNYFNLTRHADDAEHASLVAALRAGVVTMGELRLAIAGCYGLSVALGAWLLYLGGLPVAVLATACILASLAYSAGPYPLGDHGLGDVLFFVFFGLVSVGGAYYVQAASILGQPLATAPVPGALPLHVLVAALPMAGLITAILVIDNIRDLDYDRAKGEVTLAGLIGPRWSRVEIVALYVLSYAVPPALALAGSGPFVLLPLLTAPMAVGTLRELYRRHTHDELIPMTPRAGRVALAFGVLLAVGFAL